MFPGPETLRIIFEQKKSQDLPNWTSQIEKSEGFAKLHPISQSITRKLKIRQFLSVLKTCFFSRSRNQVKTTTLDVPAKTSCCLLQLELTNIVHGNIVSRLCKPVTFLGLELRLAKQNQQT